MIIGGDASLPFPQRADLMYLDTLKSKDVPHGFTRKGTRQCGSLITRDIEGAFPENPYERLTARRDSSFKSEATSVLNRRPREGSRPTDLSLQTRDIEFAYPKPTGFKTNRVVNPLDPEYKLPSYKEEKPPPLKFVRDTLNVSDISRAIERGPRKRRGNDEIGDSSIDKIEGSTPNQLVLRASFFRPPQECRLSSSLHCQDINGPKRPHHVVARHNNPNDPVYILPNWTVPSHIWTEESIALAEKGESQHHGKQLVIGHIEKSRPRVHARAVRSPFYPLITEDIAGATSSRCIPLKPKKGGVDIYSTADIQGAQADTQRNGLKTRRHVNPLRPSYNWDVYQTQFLAEAVGQPAHQQVEINTPGKNTAVDAATLLPSEPNFPPRGSSENYLRTADVTACNATATVATQTAASALQQRIQQRIAGMISSSNNGCQQDPDSSHYLRGAGEERRVPQKQGTLAFTSSAPVSLVPLAYHKRIYESASKVCKQCAKEASSTRTCKPLTAAEKISMFVMP